MCFILLEHFTGIFIFFLIILYNPPYSNISVHATSYNSSEEIKNIFSLSHDSVLKGATITGNFAEGGLIDESSIVPGSNNISIKNSGKSLSSNHESVFTFTGLLNRHNVSFSNATRSKSYNSLQTSFTKASLPTKLIETGSNLFLGVPEVIHINGTSSIKPRKGVHYSKIVPRKGVENENEALHVSLENQLCFWLSEKECYSNKEMKCNCCKEGNLLGKKIKQTPVNCKNCKMFNVLLSDGNQTCKNICCNAINNNLYSLSSSQNNYLNYQTVPSTEVRQHNLSLTIISEKIDHESSKSIGTKENNNVINFEKNPKFKPLITKVPYDSESINELIGKPQEKVFVPLAVSFFLLPLMGVIIFFFWQRTKEYCNKRYYKRMDFLIDGIYND